MSVNLLFECFIAIECAAGWRVFCEDLWLWLSSVVITSNCGWSRWS